MALQNGQFTALRGRSTNFPKALTGGIRVDLAIPEPNIITLLRSQDARLAGDIEALDKRLGATRRAD